MTSEVIARYAPRRHPCSTHKPLIRRTTAIDPNDIANAYLALWNDADEASRHARLRAGWSADARYTDSMTSGDGHDGDDGIAAMIAGARTQFPGHGFTLSGRRNWTARDD